MGLMPPPTYDTGWIPCGGAGYCHICGIPIVHRALFWNNNPDLDRHLLRHGGEGGAVGEYHEGIEVDPVPWPQGNENWERPWERRVHAAMAAGMVEVGAENGSTRVDDAPVLRLPEPIVYRDYRCASCRATSTAAIPLHLCPLCGGVLTLREGQP